MTDADFVQLVWFIGGVFTLWWMIFVAVKVSGISKDIRLIARSSEPAVELERANEEKEAWRKALLNETPEERQTRHSRMSPERIEREKQEWLRDH